jgi:lipid-A-disaccharide synthase
VTRIFLVAGESSGDMHGANLVRALRRKQPDMVCEGLGGQRMAEAGMALRNDLAGKAVMGFSEVVRALPEIRRVFFDTVAYLARTRPDAVVLIDYPGFNVRLGKRANGLGIPVIYYIGPQVWAWRKQRIHAIARMVRKMLVILPFEEKLYTDLGVDCTYVGHPLLDHIASAPPTSRYRDGMVIGILPGSRAQEIQRLLGTMLEVAQGIRDVYPAAQFVTPCVDEAREQQVRRMTGGFSLETTVGNTYEVLNAARFCLVASGTATLETALFGVPMVILYRVSPVNYWIARRVVDIKHIGIVNILAARGIVPEFIQHAARSAAILPRALELIGDTPARETMLADLAAIRSLLGEPGASDRAAAAILAVLGEQVHG